MKTSNLGNSDPSRPALYPDLRTLARDLGIAYSPKAIGLNQDLFSHADFCLPATNLDPQAFREKITELVRSADEVRKLLREQIPKLKSQAWAAGDILRNGIS